MCVCDWNETVSGKIAGQDLPNLTAIYNKKGFFGKTEQYLQTQMAYLTLSINICQWNIDSALWLLQLMPET